MLLTRRSCLAAIGGAALGGCKMSPVARPSAERPADPAAAKKSPPKDSMARLQTFTPENFGAAGDGVTNDTAAFAQMTAAVIASGGGTVLLQKKTYVVGEHLAAPTPIFSFPPAPIMEFDGCAGPLIILGNGARLRCADGLRFGTFDPLTGVPTHHAMPYTGTGELASPYLAMITVQNCTGKVHIENLELDGNFMGLEIGGTYGDTGWQIPAYGLRLINNVAGETVVAVHTHHQPVDGVLIDAPATRNGATELDGIVSEYNVRQGCSVIGGSNFSFSNCQFNHTGKAGMVSSPGAGFDIEAETNPIRNLSFSNCEFSNNTGTGMGADSGDSEGASFSNCRFIGTTNWAAWPRKPNFRFDSCAFVGSICNTYGDSDPTRAAQFTNCGFYDDPALSPTHEVYNATFPIADLSDFANVLFDGCTFKLTGDLVLPWTINVIYRDNVMSQLATKQAYPRGTFIGTNRIDGNVDLSGSHVLGDLTVNGQLVARTS